MNVCPRPARFLCAVEKITARIFRLAVNYPYFITIAHGIFQLSRLVKIKKQRAKVIIGTPVYPSDMYDENKSEKQNIEDITAALRQKIIKLGRILNEKEQSIVI